MAKISSGGATDWKRRVEGDVNKLLGGQPRRADAARRLVDELLKGGIRRTTAARMVCASESDDPGRCAVTIPEKPRSSLAKSDRPLFQGEINWTKPRSSDTKKDRKATPSVASKRQSVEQPAEKDRRDKADARQVKISQLLMAEGFGKTGDIWSFAHQPNYVFRLRDGMLSSGSLDEKREFVPLDKDIRDPQNYIYWFAKEALAKRDKRLAAMDRERAKPAAKASAPKAPLQVGQRVRVRADRVVHFGPSYAGRAGTITKPNRVGGWYVRLDSVPRETVPKELLLDSTDLEVLAEPIDQAVADQYELRQQRARQVEQETERFMGDRYSPDLDATEISRRLRSEIAALIKSTPKLAGTRVSITTQESTTGATVTIEIREFPSPVYTPEAVRVFREEQRRIPEPYTSEAKELLSILRRLAESYQKYTRNQASDLNTANFFLDVRFASTVLRDQAAQPQPQEAASPAKAPADIPAAVDAQATGREPSDDAAMLATHSLRLTEKMTAPTRPGKKPRPVWEVTGDTGAYEPLLRELGGNQRFRRGTWTFWDDPKEALIEALRSKGRPSIEAREQYQREGAAMRAEKHASRADKASERSQAAYSKVRAIGDMIPFGQPILVGHHSERRARRDAERIDRGMRVSVEEHKKAEESARLAEVNQRQAETERPVDYWVRKLKDIEAQIRKLEKDLLRPHSSDIEKARIRQRLPLLRTDKAGLEAKIEALGGVKYDAQNIAEGSEVLWNGKWYPVISTNPKTVTVGRWITGNLSSKNQLPYEELKGTRSASDLKVERIDPKAGGNVAGKLVKAIANLETLEKIDRAFLRKRPGDPQAEVRKVRLKQTQEHAREALAQLVELVKPGDRVQLFTANWGKVQQRSKDGFQLEGGKLRPWSELLSHEVQHGKA